MSFLVLPPEINSSRMFSGAGPDPMLAAAAAWDGLADELSAAAGSFSSVNSALAGQAWQGPAAAAMVAAAAPYSAWLSSAASQAADAAAQAKAVASAFESALAATVRPVVVNPNAAKTTGRRDGRSLGIPETQRGGIAFGPPESRRRCWRLRTERAPPPGHRSSRPTFIAIKNQGRSPRQTIRAEPPSLLRRRKNSMLQVVILVTKKLTNKLHRMRKPGTGYITLFERGAR